MYCLKKIINNDEDIILPKCMYNLTPIFNIEDLCSQNVAPEVDLNIGKQVLQFLQTPNKRMAELEIRQYHLLQKLDKLYERIKTISSLCGSNTSSNYQSSKAQMEIPDEIVLVCSPDNLPWFLPVIHKLIGQNIKIAWHIHSSVPLAKVNQTKLFAKALPPNNGGHSKVNIRLIIKNVSLNSELRLSSLQMPIIGNVNILRYIALAYPDAIIYEENYTIESLLDMCHVLERTNQKNKEELADKIFSQYLEYIHKEEKHDLYNKGYSIVEIAIFSIIKQWKNIPKIIPQRLINKFENLLK